MRVVIKEIIVSESEILGPIDHFSDIENLVSFERAMFKDFSFKNRIKIFLLFMSMSPHWNTYLKHHEGAHVKYKDDTILSINSCVI